SVLAETSPTNGDRMTGFATLERDNVIGLDLAVYREQNARTGRWGSVDPLGFAAGDANAYRYTGNAPTNFADPSGMQQARKPPTFAGQRGGTQKTPEARTRPITIETGQDNNGTATATVKPGTGVPGLPKPGHDSRRPKLPGFDLPYMPGQHPYPG